MKKIIFSLVTVVSVLSFSCEMLEEQDVYTAPDNRRFAFAQNSVTLLEGEIAYLPFDMDNTLKKAGNLYFSYDEKITEINREKNGLYIRGLKKGETILAAASGELETQCLIKDTRQFLTQKV